MTGTKGRPTRSARMAPAVQGGGGGGGMVLRVRVLCCVCVVAWKAMDGGRDGLGRRYVILCHKPAPRTTFFRSTRNLRVGSFAGFQAGWGGRKTGAATEGGERGHWNPGPAQHCSVSSYEYILVVVYNSTEYSVRGTVL